MDKHDLKYYATVAEEAAREAGSLIRAALEERGSTGLVVEDKAAPGAGHVDLVTEVDRRAEEVIIGRLQAALPTHRFVGEESAFLSGIAGLTNEPTWFIDPLDGTVNFVHGYPFVTVSIGLWINKQAAVGVIFNPFLDEMYKGWKGGGATLNGQPLKVSGAKALSEAIIATTLGSGRDVWYLRRLMFRLRSLLLRKLHGFRMSGSTAQNIAMVSSGRIDVYYDQGGYGGPWDVAAGVLLVEEAGGVVHSFPEGGDFELHMGKGNMICGNAEIVDQVVKAVKEAERGARRKILTAQVGIMLLPVLGAVLMGMLSTQTWSRRR